MSVLNLDLDTKVIDEKGFEKSFIDTRIAILKQLGLTYRGYVKKISIKCKKCNRSWVVSEKEVGLFDKCKFCGSKELTTSRGYHIQIEIKEDLTEEERNKIEWLLGSDEMKIWLTQQKLNIGIDAPNLFFSEVRWRKPQSKECRGCPYIKILQKIAELSDLVKSLDSWIAPKKRCKTCGAKNRVEVILNEEKNI